MRFYQRWFSSIWRVLIKPTPETFTDISNDVEDVFGESILLISMITTVLFVVVISKGYFKKTLYLNLIGSILLLILFILLFTYFISFLKERIFQNHIGCNEKLFFSIVVIILISIIIDLLLITLLPNVVFLGYASTLYSIILFIICIKSITKLKYWQSIITFFLSTILAIVSVVIVGFFFGRLIQIIPYWFDYY